LKTAYVEVRGPSRIYYREAGVGTPLVFLHGGWGYEVYPFDHQIAALQDRFRILIPDRSGYGRSSPIEELPADFHSRAAAETMRFLDALGIDRAVLWGHSDGSVIATLCGLAEPRRVTGLILEAFHYQSAKHGSHDWMRSVMLDPDSVGERARSALIRDHGDGWRKVVERNASAWLEIARVAGPDMYDGRLWELHVPALFLFGGDDPRTEPGDMELVRQALPRAEFRIIEGARHSPHSGRDSAEECTHIASEFLRRLVAGASASLD